jgi:type II secretory pathway component PulF
MSKQTDISEMIKLKYAKFMMGTKSRLGLYQKLATFLEEGVPLNEVITGLAKEYKALSSWDPRAIMLNQWRSDIEDGMTLSNAMKDWCPPGESMLIQAGESSGQLAESFTNALTSTESATKMKSSIIAAMAYPGILFSMLFLIMYMFSTQAVPKLAAAKDPAEWPGASQALYHLAQFVEHKWWVVLLAVFAFILFANWSTKNLTGPVRNALDVLPPWSIYKSFQSSVFLISTSAMMKTGTPIFESIKSLENMSPRYVSFQLRYILHKLESGRPIGEAMNSGFLDVETGVDIKIFGQTASIEQAMESIGRTSIKNAIERIEAVSALLNIFAMGMVAGFIGWVYYSFFILTQSIGQ